MQVTCSQAHLHAPSPLRLATASCSDRGLRLLAATPRKRRSPPVRLSLIAKAALEELQPTPKGTGDADVELPWHNQMLPESVRNQIVEFSQRRAQQAGEEAVGPLEESAVDASGEPAAWVYPVVQLWEELQTRPSDIAGLVRHGESHPYLRDPEAIAAGVRKLKALLPEACVPSMVLREPTCMLIDMVKGAYLVMQLQDFLQEKEGRALEMTFEINPALLLLDNIPKQVDKTIAHLSYLKPIHSEESLMQIVRDNPALLFRVHLYPEFLDLPYDIQNLLYHHRDGEEARLQQYAEQWDRWEWDIGDSHHPDFDPVEWMMNGYDDSLDNEDEK